MPTKDDLKMMQALPLSLKVRMTQQRIRDWVREFGEDGLEMAISELSIMPTIIEAEGETHEHTH